MSNDRLHYDPAAALALLPHDSVSSLASAVLAARDETLNDVELWQSGREIPSGKQPLDAGFIQWPEELLSDLNRNGAASLVARIEASAARLRSLADSVVVLGIGGSYMGMRAMFESLCSPVHNELPRAARGEIPRIYFDGWNVDSDSQQALLSLIEERGRQLDDGPGQRTAVIVISKSGGTLETAVAFRLYRDLIEKQFADLARELIVPVTGESGRLRKLSLAAGYRDVFSIPDGIGGRFSVLTAVGLLPAAVAGIDIRQLLQGAADMTAEFRTAEFSGNPVLQFVAVSHAFEKLLGMTTRVLSTWGSKLEAAGLWYDQLLSESLGKHEQGATPITVVNTRDLHSRGQQHQEGRRDKLITNLFSQRPQLPPLIVPAHPLDQDQLNQLSGVTLPRILQAAAEGTNKAYADERRPTADLVLPVISAYSIGQLFQMLMLATAVEGRLIGVNPYGQPGVEAYKRNMQSILGIR